MLTLYSYSQPAPSIQYKDMVFSAVSVNRNLAYKNAADGKRSKYYLLDVYQPNGDSSSLRPLIIWIHGGGFKFGNKKSRGIPLWSKGFAQRGYVCAAVNYRLSKKNTLSDYAALVNACSDAVEDINDAVIFLKQNHKQYRIDTTKIVFAGNSAGGIIALQSVYSSALERKRLANPADSATAETTYNPAGIAAVVNLWGGLFDSTWLRNANVPIVSVHGSDDKIVPFNRTGNGGIYGSLIIHRNADSLHINNSLKIFEGFSHELQKNFNPLWVGGKTKERWREGGQFAADFLYGVIFKGTACPQKKIEPLIPHQ
ncbi:MAG TPA: alpha/beta hydrolase [Agriterribacter sp.]|nr:alpha/beta hydrolase [Agriterribacter sp.]